MNLDSICYKNTPIKNVIFKIDFVSKLVELNSQLPQPITDVIKKSFPIAEPKDIIARELQISNENIKENNKSIKEWHFHTNERNATLVIKDDSFGIVVNNYISFEKVNEVFLGIKNIFFQQYNGLMSRRLGLRYINEINLNGNDPLNWDGLINKNLLAIIKATPKSENIIRAFHNLEIKENDILLKFQYGIFNSDYPAIIKKKSFILDLDASYNGMLGQHEIDEFILQQHNLIQEHFEFAITKKLRTHFQNLK